MWHKVSSTTVEGNGRNFRHIQLKAIASSVKFLTVQRDHHSSLDRWILSSAPHLQFGNDYVWPVRVAQGGAGGRGNNGLTAGYQPYIPNHRYNHSVMITMCTVLHGAESLKRYSVGHMGSDGRRSNHLDSCCIIYPPEARFLNFSWGWRLESN